MSADQHFKAAANALANARQEKQREIDDLRQKINHQEVDVKHSVQDMNSQIRNFEADMVRTAQNDNNQEADRQKARLLHSISVLRRNISDTEASMARQKQQMLDHIKQLEREVIGIDQQIRDFETRS